MSQGLGETKPTDDRIAVIFAKMIANYITPYGGIINMYRAQVDLVEGEVVMAGSIVPGADGVPYCTKNAIDSDAPIGAVYADANIGELVKIVVAGRAYLLPESGVTATVGYIAYSGNSEAGRVDQNATIPGTTQHWREIGHFVETGAGAGLKALADLHKN